MYIYTKFIPKFTEDRMMSQLKYQVWVKKI